MITELKALQRLLKLPKDRGGYAGVILYEGPSQIDGAPIVVVANRIMTASNNSKTGAMVQTWILRSDVAPQAAIDAGLDASVCGSCVHRPANKREDGTGGDCYVTIFHAPRSVYVAYREGRYLKAGVDFALVLVPRLFAGLAFRMGSYGDPAAAPFPVWRMATVNAAFVNGYSHQWQDARFQSFRRLCMASADSAAEMEKAHAMGWRTFRVRDQHEPVLKGLEVVCPASKEAGHKTSCADCKACGGLSAKAKVSMVIVAHGAKSPKLELAA